MHLAFYALSRRLPLLVFLSGTLLLTACGSGYRPSEYVNYIEDPANGFVLSASKGSTRIECIYLPADYMTVQYFKRNDIDRAEYEKVYNEMKHTLHFRLVLHGIKEMNLRPGYFDFDFQQQMEAAIAGADLKPAFYLPEHDNAMKDEKRILIGFPVQELPDRCAITIHWIDGTDVYFTFDRLKDKPPVLKI